MTKREHIFINLFAILVLLSLASFGIYKYYLLTLQNKAQTQTIQTLEQKIARFEEDITKREEEKNSLVNSLLAEQEKVNQIGSEFEKIADTVNTLEKLSKTDKELLQKYSKIYFLNEHYIPEKLTLIDQDLLATGRKEIYIHSKVNSYLEKMFEDAQDDGIDLRVISGYRSFETQKALKSAYSVNYGKGANTFSADQGFSEHQLGTTLDFTTKQLGQSFASFEQTKAYQWLNENAHRYGFTLSYPKGNTFYIFEPWHWRFVGLELAGDLHEDGKHFYDLEQREIDTYLVNIFD